MAALVDPGRVRAAHQSLHRLIANARWDDDAVLAAVRAAVLPSLVERGAIRAWIVADTGFPKKGTPSVGVARQYCGQLGKQDNCQIALTLSVANDHGSRPVAYRLYLPEGWASDPTRRANTGVPANVVFRTKPAIALDQLRRARGQTLPTGAVLAGAGYGNDKDFRDGITALGLSDAVGIHSGTTVWAPGLAPLPAKPWSGRGRPPTRLRRDADHQPVAVKALALSRPPDSWRTVTWREGATRDLSSRFAAVRVRPAHRDTWQAEPTLEEWLPKNGC